MTNNYDLGERCERPWGKWAVIDKGQGFIVKRVEVISGERLSLQYHNHRYEVWAIVQGKGEVIVDGTKREVAVGDTVIVPKKSHHRISSTGDEALVFIETQVGEILDEQDIVRLEDDYKRKED